MPYAYNTAAKAVDWARQFNRLGTRWSAKLSIGAKLGHSSINLYADQHYVGTLQGDLLGPALYKEKVKGSVEGRLINLTWHKVLVGIDETYAHPTGWGSWMCHDITAAIFRRWGLRGQDVYNAAYVKTPFGRKGLVVARIAAILTGVPVVTTMGIIGHDAWNKYVDMYRSIPDYARPPNNFDLLRGVRFRF